MLALSIVAALSLAASSCFVSSNGALRAVVSAAESAESTAIGLRSCIACCGIAVDVV